VRRGGIVGAHLFLPEGGSLALALVRGRRTLAEGACSLLAAGRCRFALRLTRNGRVLLRFSRRFRASLTLAYAPRTGRVLLMHTAVILGRTGSTPPRLGGHA
jgi:hypothetical protein